MAARRIELVGLPGLPIVAPGDDLATLILAGVGDAGLTLQPGDVLVVAQKIVSKAEGRFVDLASVSPGEEARALAAKCDKDPRLVELILRESRAVLRYRTNLVVVEHRLGFVVANAGIDASNVGQPDRVLLLPENPDASARRLRETLRERCGAEVAVIVNDSVGRAWRMGTVGTALGCAGLPALVDLRGRPDLFGRALQVSETGLADELASAASLLQGEAAEAMPVVLIRGADVDGPDTGVGALVRPAERDMFR